MSMDQQQEKQNAQLFDIKRSALMGMNLMNVLSAGHRLVHYWPGTAGKRAIDRFTVLSAGIGFPCFTAAWPPLDYYQSQNASMMWLGLMGSGLVHAVAARWSRRRRHSQEMGQAIFGRLEVPVALGVAYAASAWAGPGAGFYLVAALAANVLQIALIRARFQRTADLRFDAEFEAEEFKRYVDR